MDTDALLQTLLDVFRVDHTVDDLSRILQVALDGAIALAEARRGSFYLKHGDGLRCVVGHGDAGISRTIAHDCLATGKPIYVPVVAESDVADVTSLTSQRTSSLICIPVRNRDEALGVLYMDKGPESKPLDRRIRSMMLLFAEGVGIAISHAGAYANLAEQVTRQSEADQFCGLVGRHPTMTHLYRQVQQIAASGIDPPVLIQGESGTGKELVARALHLTSSRRGHPFIPVNCAAIPQELFEAELFGFRAGAFTGAAEDHPGLFLAAQGGTLFLDEIGELDLLLQAKLLRTLQEKRVQAIGSTGSVPVDIWVISATNQDLRSRTGEGLFREDLYYRIHSTTLSLPPLRERREDIPLLMAEFGGEEPMAMSPDVERFLQRYDWPGNVRELKNLCDHLRIFAGGSLVTLADLPSDMRDRAAVRPERSDPRVALSGRSMDEIKGLALEAAIEAQVREQLDRGTAAIRVNKTALARSLEVSRNTIDNMLARYPIDIAELIVRAGET